MTKKKNERAPFKAPEGYMSRTETMKYLSISNATIYHLELRGLLHSVQMGVYNLYLRSEVEALKQEREKE